METFKQKSKVGIAGSFINQMMGNNSTLPEVGKGATQLHYTDRTCFEVVEVSKDYKTVKLEYLEAEADKTKKCDIGHENWILKPSGRFLTVIWRNNAWRIKTRNIIFTDEIIKEAEENGFYSISAYLKKNKSDLYNKIYQPENPNYHGYPLEIIEGITKEKFEYPVIKLLFGTKDYYYDWSF